MSTKVDTTTIVKFNGTNYVDWCFQVTLVLEAAGILPIVDGTTRKPATSPDDWITKDVRAKNIISSTFHHEQLRTLFECKTSHEMWAKIKSSFDDKSEFTKQLIWTRYFNAKPLATDCLVDYYTRVESDVALLRNMGETISDSSIVSKIVSSLPSNMKAFKSSWDSVVSSSQTMAYLLVRLRKEDLEKQQFSEQKEERHKAHAYNASQQTKPNNPQRKKQIEDLKKRTRCNFCKKIGHWVKECKEKALADATGQANQGQANANVGNATAKAFMALDKNFHVDANIWYLDSGASRHMCGDRSRFIDFKEYGEPRSVSIADGKELNAIGEGTIPITAFIGSHWTQDLDNEKWEDCFLINVMYVPKIKSLFSQGTMVKNGYELKANTQRATFFDGKGRPSLSARFSGDMYLMNIRFRENDIEKALIATSKIDKSDIQLWHQRLGHCNFQTIIDTKTRNAVKGLEDIAYMPREKYFCEDCCFGKQTRLPYRTVTDKRKFQKGELVHADLSGPFRTQSLGGHHYFLLTKDAASTFRMVDFLTKKSEAPDRLIENFEFLRTQTGNKVKVFKSDCGTEYLKLQDYMMSQGIVHETSTPRCPQQNGAIEKDIRTVKDHARTIMLKANFPESLWGESVADAVYILNRILNKNSPNNQTAFEIIRGKKPNLEHMRVIGSPAYAHVTDERRTAWAPKSEKMYLVGYDNSCEYNYRLIDANYRSISIHRNVVFNESFNEYTRIVFSKTQDFPQPGSDTESDSAEEGEDTLLEKEPKGDTRGDSNTELSDTASGGSVNTPDLVNLQIDTPSGSYQVNVPKNAKSTVDVPVGKGKTKTLKVDTYSQSQNDKLRPKEVLKKPDRYHANIAFVVPQTIEEALSGPDGPLWQIAIDDELASHRKNGTWILVPREEMESNNCTPLKMRWVFSLKYRLDGTIEKRKARLVICGYAQRYGVNYEETWSTVVRHEMIRLALAISAMEKLELLQFDIKCAFLHGTIDTLLYCWQPEGCVENGKEEWVCKALKGQYGLKQASRLFNVHFKRLLEDMGFKQTLCDSCVYIGCAKGVKVYILLYIDDGLIMSSLKEANEEVASQIGKSMEITIGSGDYYVGYEINRHSDGSITLTQQAYIRELVLKYGLEDARAANVPMQPNEEIPQETQEVNNPNLPFPNVIGSLIYPTMMTHPEAVYSVGRLARRMAKYTPHDFHLAKYVIRYLSGVRDFGIHFDPCSENHSHVLIGFCDADFANDPESRKSTSGWLFMLCGGIISWSSQRQSIIALSSCEAEYTCLSEAAREAIYLRGSLKEWGHPQANPTTIFIDNQSAIRWANNPENHKKSKHIQVKQHFARKAVEDGEISLSYIPTNEQTADILTKPLLKSTHARLRREMGMESLSVIKSTKQAGKWKPLNGLGNLLLSLFYCFLLLTSGMAYRFEEVVPVLWRSTEKPVTTGYSDVRLSIKFVSPCKLLNAEILHHDVVNATRFECDKLYEELFMTELEKFCPVEKTETQVTAKTRDKRFVVIAIGMIISVVIIMIGVQVHTLQRTMKNEEKIEEMKGKMDIFDRMFRNMERKYDLQSDSIHEMQKSVEGLAHALGLMDKDYTEFKSKQPGSIFISSYILSKIMIAQQILRDSRRAWVKGKIHAPLMDVLNITLPCKDRCPLDLARPVLCAMNEQRTKIDLRFNAIHVNKTIHVLKADPFRLMIRTSTNKTCSVRYIGPDKVLHSEKGDCTFPLNTQAASDNDLVVIPNNGCAPGKIVVNSTRFWASDYCVPTQLHDEDSFVQAKYYNNAIYIYCYGSKILIDGRQQVCPERAFRLPHGKPFVINNKVFRADNLYVENQAKTDPLLNFRANLDLRPMTHMSEIMTHLEKSEALLNQADKITVDEFHGHFIKYSMYLILMLIVLMIAGLLIFYMLYKRWATKGFNISIRGPQDNDPAGMEMLTPRTQRNRNPDSGGVLDMEP